MTRRRPHAADTGPAPGQHGTARRPAARPGRPVTRRPVTQPPVTRGLMNGDPDAA